MHASGDGTELNPVTISADAVVSMAELTDVLDPTGPQEGEVPVWTTDHWEFKTPASAPPGAVNVGAGLAGDGSSGAPLKANASGIWGQGSMLVPPFPVDSGVGVPIYVDNAGALRAKPYPIAHVDLITYSGADADLYHSTTGWTCTKFDYVRWGAMCQVDMDITRTGAAIAGTSNGNLTDIVIGVLGPKIPLPVHTCLLASSGPGKLVMGWVSVGTKNVNLTATVPNQPIAQNEQFSLGGWFITAASMEVKLADGVFQP